MTDCNNNMEKYFPLMPSRLVHCLRHEDSQEQDKVASEDKDATDKAAEGKDAVTELRKEKEPVRYFQEKISPTKVQILAWQLYHLKLRRPEILQELREDLKLAEATVEEYMTQFQFKRMCVVRALRSFLKVFWPENEPEIQDLLLTHFSCWYLKCIGYSLTFQPGVYYATCAIIILNADLNGRHKGRKMTCEEFRANLNNICNDYEYNQEELKSIYKSIKAKPLKVFIVKARNQAVDKNEISAPKDSGCKSSSGTDKNPTTTVHKTGHLICKKVMDKNGRKIRKGRRTWKPFTAVLKGMVLHLQKDTSDMCKKDSKNAIRLHHAMAHPVDHKNRPHVLCLRTTDSRLFYFQAESEVEQTSWVKTINLTAARYSAPPLTSASWSIKTHYPLVLPSFPTTLSVEQQLENHRDQLQRLLKHMDYYLKLPLLDGDFGLDYMEQEVKRYTIYVRVLQELGEGDAGEVTSVSATSVSS